MAETTRQIFNSAATDKLRSPDDLDKYVRVTNPSVWVIMAACIALLVGLLAWGMFGAVTTNVSATGVSVDGRAMCFLTAEDVAKVQVGDAVAVGGEGMTVANVAAVPVSRDEAHDIIKSDYLVSTLITSDWAYQVTFEGDTSDLPDGVPLYVSITTDQVPPITLILGGNA